MAAYIASCCGALACSGFRIVGTSIASSSARAAYCSFFALSLIVSWILRYQAKPLIEKIPCAHLCVSLQWRHVGVIPLFTERLRRSRPSRLFTPSRDHSPLVAVYSRDMVWRSGRVSRLPGKLPFFRPPFPLRSGCAGHGRPPAQARTPGAMTGHRGTPSPHPARQVSVQWMLAPAAEAARPPAVEAS